MPHPALALGCDGGVVVFGRVRFGVFVFCCGCVFCVVGIVVVVAIVVCLCLSSCLPLSCCVFRFRSAAAAAAAATARLAYYGQPVPYLMPGNNFANGPLIGKRPTGKLFLFFLFSSSGGWEKISSLPHFHVFSYTSCVDLTQFHSQSSWFSVVSFASRDSDSSDSASCPYRRSPLLPQQR